MPSNLTNKQTTTFSHKSYFTIKPNNRIQRTLIGKLKDKHTQIKSGGVDSRGVMV